MNGYVFNFLELEVSEVVFRVVAVPAVNAEFVILLIEVNGGRLRALLEEHLVFAVSESTEFYRSGSFNAVSCEFSMAIAIQIYSTAGLE